MLDDGTKVSYHRTINVTCKEKSLMDIFSGWELELPQPVEEFQVCINKKLQSHEHVFNEDQL